MSSSKTLLKNIIGVEGYESLEKAIYRSGTQSVADPLELYLPLLVVPRAILSWLVQNIRPMKVGEHKEFKYPGQDDINIHIEKQSTDVYRGEMVQKGRIIHNFEKQSLPSIGGHLMTVFEDYSGLAAKDTVTEDRQKLVDEHEHLVDTLKSPSKEDDKKEAKEQEKELEELKSGDSKEVVRSIMDIGGVTAERADPEAVKWLTAHANIKELTSVVGKLVDALVSKQIKNNKLLDEADDTMAKEEMKESISPEEKAKEDIKAKKDRKDIVANKGDVECPIATPDEMVAVNENRGAPECKRVKGEADDSLSIAKDEMPTAKPKLPQPKPARTLRSTYGRSWASKRSGAKPITTEQLHAALDTVDAKMKASASATPQAPAAPAEKPSKPPARNLELEQSIHNLKNRPPMGIRRLDDESDDKLKRLQALMPAKKAEMPAGAGMAQAPQRSAKPKMPVGPSNNPAAAQKQTMASAKGLQAGPKLPGSSKMKMPGATSQGPKGPPAPKAPAGPKMNKTEYFNSLKKKKVLEPLIKPSISKSEKHYFIGKEEIYHKCNFCGMPEFKKNLTGEPELSPCACFSVMAKSEGGQSIKFAKISKTEDGNFKLSFHKSVDAESAKAFLLTLKAKLLLTKRSR